MFKKVGTGVGNHTWLTPGLLKSMALPTHTRTYVSRMHRQVKIEALLLLNCIRRLRSLMQSQDRHGFLHRQKAWLCVSEEKRVAYK